MPGGEQVRVRIDGEHEYIEIIGGGGTLTMDSGVVEVFNILPFNPGRYLPGVLVESDAVEQYNAAFTTVTANGRKNPGDTSERQLAGRITESGNVIKGLLYGEATGSFIPGYDTSAEAARTDDDSLAAKKRMAVLCPASIFTGKCRMFVQAMYGRHLYQKGGVLLNDGPQLDESQIGLSAAPALLLGEYLEAGDTATGLNVQLHTSCCVYLDSIGQHWLFAPTTGSVIVYPLIGSPSAQALRKFLWDSPNVPVNKRLSAADREHLEAYILSTCKPYILRKQTPSWPTSIAPYGMGYGWHWNWDGNTADIVINEQVAFDVSYTDMSSTHHRVSVTRATPVEPATNPDGSVTLGYLDIEFGATVVEGPTTWTIDRSQMVIAEPFWAEGYLGKTTPRLYRGLVCDAPFYVFYVRNDIKVCRAATVLNPGSNPVREATVGMAGSLIYGTNDIVYGTLGEEGGYIEERDGSNDHYQTTFTCGGVSSPPLLIGRTEGGNRTDMSAKTFVGYINDGTGISFSGTVEVGYPVGGIWATVVLNTNTTRDYGLYNYDMTAANFTDVAAGYAIVAVPMYDAEAIYTSYNTTQTRSIYSGDIKHMAADVSGFQYQRVLYAGATPYIRWGYNNGGPPSGASTISTEALSVSSTETTTLTEKLICHAGEVDFVSTHSSAFYDNSTEVVETQWLTLSSSSTTNPVVIAPGLIDQVGLDAAQAAPVIVGWD